MPSTSRGHDSTYPMPRQHRHRQHNRDHIHTITTAASLSKAQRAMDFSTASIAILIIISAYAAAWTTIKDAEFQNENIQRLSKLGMFCLYVCWLVVANRHSYNRYRNTLVVLMKLIWFCLPVTKDSIVLITRLQVQPELCGYFLSNCIKEAVAITLGSKILALSLWSVLLPLPFRLHIPSQLAAVWFAGGLEAFCSSPLLTSSTYQHRVLNTVHLFQAIPQALSGGPVIVPATQQQQCIAVGVFTRIVFGVVLPTVFLIKYAPPWITKDSLNSRVEQKVITVLNMFVSPNSKLLQHCSSGGGARGFELSRRDSSRRGGRAQQQQQQPYNPVFDNNNDNDYILNTIYENDYLTDEDEDEFDDDGSATDSVSFWSIKDEHQLLHELRKGLLWCGMLSVAWLYSCVHAG